MPRTVHLAVVFAMFASSITGGGNIDVAAIENKSAVRGNGETFLGLKRVQVTNN